MSHFKVEQQKVWCWMNDKGTFIPSQISAIKIVARSYVRGSHFAHFEQLSNLLYEKSNIIYIVTEKYAS